MNRTSLKDIVLSVEQMQHLGKLGVNVEQSVLAWCVYRHFKDKEWHIIENLEACKSNGESIGMYEEFVPTLTLQEILELLPLRWHDRIIAQLNKGVVATYAEILEITRCTGGDNKLYGFHYGSNLFNGESDENPLTAAYKMLCWVKEKQ